jgi:hypothetical protein
MIFSLEIKLKSFTLKKLELIVKISIILMKAQLDKVFTKSEIIYLLLIFKALLINFQK